MIKYIAFLFMLASVQSPLALASNLCDEIHQDLIAIEQRIQTSKLNQCNESHKRSKRIQLCNDNTEATNKSMLKVQEEYNAAMAKLILMEGFVTIGKTLEDNHNSLNLLTRETINDARVHIAKLEDSLDKANALSLSMKKAPNTTKNFWNGFKRIGMSQEKLKSAIKNKCANKKEYKKYQDFCNEVNIGLTEAAYSALFGFLKNAQNESKTSYTQYKAYKEMLKIKVSKSDQLVSPKVYKDYYFGKNGKMTTLKKELALYRVAPTKKLRDSILTKTKSLDGVYVNYNYNRKRVEASVTPQQISKFKDFINHSEGIQKELNILNLPDTLLTGSSHKNLSKKLSLIKKDQNSNRVIIGKHLSKKMSFLKACQNRSAQETYTCFINECKPNAYGDACQNLKGTQADQLFRDYIAQNNKNDRIIDGLQRAKGCYTHETLAKKKQCLQSEMASIPGMANTTLAKLKQEVENKRKALDLYMGASPFQNLNRIKLVMLDQLNKSKCQQEFTKSENYHSTCNLNEVSSFKNEALTLASEGNDISIKLNQQIFNKDKNNKYTNQYIAKNTQELKEGCLDNPQSFDVVDNFCKRMISQRQREEDRASLFNNSKPHTINSAKLEEIRKKNEPSLWESGLRFLSNGIGQYGKPAMSEYFRTKEVEQNARNQINYIQQRQKMQSYYSQMQQNQNNFMASVGAHSQINYSNYGYQYRSPTYAQTSTFQSSNSSNIFNISSNPFQYSYTTTSTVPFTSGFSSSI